MCKEASKKVDRKDNFIVAYEGLLAEIEANAGQLILFNIVTE
jgi:hypothetical protein